MLYLFLVAYFLTYNNTAITITETTIPIKNKPIIQPSWFPCTYSQESKGSNTQGMVLAIPICNLQRCLARSIFGHLELVLFYTVKFYLASYFLTCINTAITIIETTIPTKNKPITVYSSTLLISLPLLYVD